MKKISKLALLLIIALLSFAVLASVHRIREKTVYISVLNDASSDIYSASMHYQIEDAISSVTYSGTVGVTKPPVSNKTYIYVPYDKGEYIDLFFKTPNGDLVTGHMDAELILNPQSHAEEKDGDSAVQIQRIPIESGKRTVLKLSEAGEEIYSLDFLELTDRHSLVYDVFELITSYASLGIIVGLFISLLVSGIVFIKLSHDGNK